jgi:hypothetical protein
MPCFYFHLREGNHLIEDLDGSELPNLEAARAKAVAATREAIAEQLRTGQAVGDRCFEIADEGGRVLTTVTLRDAVWLH